MTDTAGMNLGNLAIVEDDSFSRTLLATSLKSFGFNIAISGATAGEALALFLEKEIDVALLDLDLGKGPNGIDIAYKMRELRHDVGLILITSFSDHRASGDSRRLLPQGMRHITKSKLADINELVKIIIDTNHRPLRRSPLASMESSPLTDNQLDVLRLINQGLSNQEIARQLHVTVSAVEKTISRINQAAGLKTNSAINQRISLVKYFAKLTGKDNGNS